MNAIASISSSSIGLEARMSWRKLSPTALPHWRRRKGIDPQLVWAEATLYRHFAVPHIDGPKQFIVELHPGEIVESLVRELGADPGRGRVSTLYADKQTRYCTAVLSAQYVRDVLEEKLGRMIRRFELQVPLRPERTPKPTRPAGTPAYVPEPSSSRVLVGVVDDGCPFANARLLDPSGAARVVGLWDQNDVDPPCASLPYGRAWTKPDLDRVIGNHRRSGAIDEMGCYEALGLSQLRRRESHGAFVTDLFAGKRSLGRRLNRDPDGVPTWAASRDAAADADVVFVQFPRELVQDSSSAALPSKLLDGLRYVLLHSSATTERVVVNVSDGSSRGTHDGESIIERAMAELVAEFEASGHRSLHVVIPAGNSFVEARHAQVDGLEAGAQREVRLVLPPGSESAAQIVVRIPSAVTDLKITLVPPNAKDELSASIGEGYGWHSNGQLLWGIVLPKPIPGYAAEGLISFAPTISMNLSAVPVTAPSGFWRIRMSSALGFADSVHLHVCRSQTNLGALNRSEQARFVDADETYDPTRYLRLAKSDPIPPRSPIRRQGTLNSLTSGQPGLGVVVVGGSDSRRGVPAEFASSGPSATVRRIGPDIAAVADVSDALAGLTGAAVASGDHARLRGSSFAAPQVARSIANTGRLPTRVFGAADTLRTGMGTMEPE
jgi:hypothetical protein